MSATAVICAIVIATETPACSDPIDLLHAVVFLMAYNHQKPFGRAGGLVGPMTLFSEGDRPADARHLELFSDLPSGGYAKWPENPDPTRKIR
jgi:hypothetical protein